MQLAFFNDFRLGVVQGGQIVDVTASVKGHSQMTPQQIMTFVIEHFSELRPDIEAAVKAGPLLNTDGVKLRPPLPAPGNIVCMAVNYMEDGTLAEAAPINAFPKSHNAIIGPGDTMILPDAPASVFEGEAELAIVIGKRASNVKAANAMQYIFGYTNFIDGSARGLPPAGNVFFQMKSRDTFAPIGPYIVTADEIADPQELPIKLWVNGALRQSFNSNDMAHKIARCIEWVSAIHTLNPGDVLATGTNHRGLNAFQDGDVVEMETQGLGRLKINVKDDLKRTWSRETRLERTSKGLKGLTPQLSGKYTPAAS